MNFTIIHVFFLVLLCRIMCFSLSQNFCKLNHTQRILTFYFQHERCLVIIKLTEDVTDVLNIQFHIPKLIKVEKENVSYNFNMATRPRRDIFDPNRTINKMCPETQQGYLIIARTVGEILNYIFAETITPFWSAQAQIFIYFTEETCANVTEIFKNLWNIYKTPHVVISGCRCNSILFFNPFVKNGNKWGKIFSYLEENVLHDKSVITNDMTNFNGYPIRPVLFRSPFTSEISKNNFEGIDVELLKLLANRINFTAEILFPYDNDQYGFRLSNGTYTGALRRLLDGDADYINVNYFIKDYLTIDIEFGVSTITDNLCVIMKKAEKIPEWQILYYCFDTTVWIVIIVTFFLVALAWLALEKAATVVLRENEMNPFIFTDTFRIMITSSIHHLPTAVSERLFLSMCLLAFVTLVGAFQGSLTGIYTKPMFYQDIDTLEDLSETNTKIKSEFMFFINDVFSDMSYPVIAKLKNMISFYNDTVSITKRVAEENNFATLVRQSEVKIQMNTTNYYNEDGENIIHMVKECPRTYSLAYPFPTNSPFAPRLNTIILRAAQSGFLVKWYTDMAFNVSLKAAKRQCNSRNSVENVLSIYNLQISFYQLLFGFVVSFAVFLCEIVINFLRKIYS